MINHHQRYEAFPNKSIHQDSLEQFLEWNESASSEAQTWSKLFQTIPRGVQMRKLKEEEEIRKKQEELKLQQKIELKRKGPEVDNWMPDEVCKVCYKCEEPFTVFRRRHHCRVCGLVFCGYCSSHSVSGDRIGFGQTPVRACDECYENYKKINKASTSSKGKSSTPSPLPPFLPQQQQQQLNIQPQMIKHKNTPPKSDDESHSIHSEPDVDDDSVSSLGGEEGGGGVGDVIDMVDPFPMIVHKREKPRFSSTEEEDGGDFEANSLAVISPLSKIFENREEVLLESLLMSENLDDIWLDTLIELARDVCETVRPNPVLEGDSLDICEYVRVQIQPHAFPSSSEKINGAVLRKNVINRFMPKYVENPRIMLLESDLEFKRGNTQIVSFENLYEQERLYLDLVVKKICTIKVDVLLVGGTVSSVAEELLVRKNVAVASLVKKKDLEWIARLTNALILPTTEYITRTTDPTGTCELWRCQTISISSNNDNQEEETLMQQVEKEKIIIRKKTSSSSGMTDDIPPRPRADPTRDTFMYFDGCFPQKGCTICLRGDTWINLKKKSNIFLDLVRKLYTIRLDHALIYSLDGNEKFVLDFCGNYQCASNELNMNPELEVLKSERIEIGRVWLQGSTQSSIPETSTRAFYGVKDRAFGDFLLRYCFDLKKTNNNMADGNYSLVFFHGHGRIRVSAERLAKADALDFHNLRIGLEEDEKIRVLTWGACKYCGYQTNVRSVGSLVMNMSFAKWLQATFYFQGVVPSGTKCKHSLFHDSLRYFFRGDFVVTIEFEPCTPLTFTVLDKLDLLKNDWHDRAASMLMEEFIETCQEVQILFRSTSVASLVERFINDLLQDHPTSPSGVNRLFRDLLLACIDWNLRINAPTPSPKNASNIKSQSSAEHKVKLRDYSSFSESNPRLKIRPSLSEIRVMRNKLLGSSPAEDRSSAPRPLSISKSTPTFENLPPPALASSYSAPSLLSPMMTKTLPSRLVEEHLLLPPGNRLGNAVVPVKEGEPTSWIAHALCSDDYSKKLFNLTGYSKDWEKLLKFLDDSSNNNVDEEILHIHCGFSDASEYSTRQCAFSIHCFYAAQFHALRMLFMTNRNDEKLSDEYFERRFIESLSRCTSWKPTGGKSRATFLKTLDDRFIIKSVSQEEFEMFRELAPKYFAHLANVFGTQHSPSMLVPFLGLYQVTMQSEVVNGKKGYFTNSKQPVIQSKMYVFVSPNIFWTKQPKVMYDLKGNAKRRFVRAPEPGAVRLDFHFFQDNRGIPLSLTSNSKEALIRAVENDSNFLSSVGVVDYSLLVGVNSEQSTLTAGIIDYLQLYNYKKMFESTVKKAAGQAEPTVVSPNKYRARFVLALERYFVSSGQPILLPML